MLNCQPSDSGVYDWCEGERGERNVNISISCRVQSQHSGGPLLQLSSDLLTGGRKESEAAASFPVVLTGNIVRDLTVISPLTQPGDAARRNTGGTSLHPLSLPPAL